MAHEMDQWWREGVLYQIYPRSFQDSNNDGIGDFQGILRRLSYVASLGVAGIWISPFFRSPMKDFGYDVSDYRDVDPIFGTLEDFKKVLDAAHDQGLKVIIDMVASHTSDRHAWFQESMRDKTNPKADWYVWADPKPDGSPPNNWQSHFGGPAWEFSVKRGQYYLHNFLKEQPDLNLHNPEVQNAMLETFRYWLDEGVDGFRLDVVNMYFHDPKLRDNPPMPREKQKLFLGLYQSPYEMQDHKFDKTQPENLEFLQKLHALLDEYPGRMMVGEIFDTNELDVMVEYINAENKCLHTAYSFILMQKCEHRSAKVIKNALEDFYSRPGKNWPSWAMSNHDVIRAATRWAGERGREDERLSKLMIALLCSLRGTPFIYQGEELGLPEAHLAYEDLRDPFGIFLYPEWQGRDGCRTPMPWVKTRPKAGFSEAERTWLPIPEEHRERAVSVQKKQKDSVLNFTQKFISWRKTRAALCRGHICFHDLKDDRVLAFTREYRGEKLFCAFNLDEDRLSLKAPVIPKNKADFDDALMGTLTQKRELKLPGFGLFYGEVI